MLINRRLIKGLSIRGPNTNSSTAATRTSEPLTGLQKRMARLNPSQYMIASTDPPLRTLWSYKSLPLLSESILDGAEGNNQSALRFVIQFQRRLLHSAVSSRMSEARPPINLKHATGACNNNTNAPARIGPHYVQFQRLTLGYTDRLDRCLGS